MNLITFIPITASNIVEEGLFCIRNPNNPGFRHKADWLEKRMDEGLRLILMKVNSETVGFIEFVPGEYAWRPVKARDYMFIQCLWVYPRKNLGKGYASQLVQYCLNVSKKESYAGVAVITSKGSWMAGKELFLKNGFTHVGTKGRFDLLTNKFREVPDPEFIDWENNATKYVGLNLVFTHQCPLFIKSVEEMKSTAREYGLELKITELKSAAEAQQAPSGFGVYSIVYNGKLLADHYVSNTRFRNILEKETGKS